MTVGEHGPSHVGATLQRLREERGLSLAATASMLSLSKNTLHRIEKGTRFLAAEECAEIERALQFDGLLALAFSRSVVEAQLQRVDPSSSWTHSFPATWSGEVWTHIRSSEADTNVRVVIQWGPWQRLLELEDVRATVSYAKGDSGLSTLLFLRTRTPCRVVFGFGRPPFEGAIDINAGWTLHGPTDLVRNRWGPTLAHLLRRSGRSPAELAEFLSMTETELLQIFRLHGISADRPAGLPPSI